MDVFKTPYYSRISKYLNVYGHWPYQSLNIRIRNQLLSMMTCFTIIIPQIIMTYEIRNNFHFFILSMPSMLYYTQFTAKNIFGFIGRKEIKKVLDIIKRDFQVHTGEDLKILIDYGKQANKFNTFYTVYMFTVCLLYSALPLTLELMDIFMPLNETRLQIKPRVIHYHIDFFDRNLFIIFHGCFIDCLSIILVIAFDSLYLSSAYHASALFVIVTKKVQSAIDEQAALVKNESSDPESNRKRTIVYQNFVKTIIMHKHVLEFVETIETAFTILNLISLGCSMLPLAISGFEALLNKNNPSEMMRFALFGFGEIMHLFYYNWPGHKISEHSELIYNACYDSDWYKEEFPIECKKLMNLMMLRGQKPSYMTAGGIYILGLENFAAIIKLSMSYFTVLSSIT